MSHLTLQLVAEGRAIGLAPTREGCLFLGPDKPTALTRLQCAQLAGWFDACSRPETTLRRCETCDADTPHEGRVCLVCNEECCFPEDGKPCRDCLADAVAAAEARFDELEPHRDEPARREG